MLRALTRTAVPAIAGALLWLSLLPACSCNRHAAPGPAASGPAADEPEADPPKAPSAAQAPAPQPKTDDRAATCCSQCLAAAQQDPQGMDLSLVPCSDYASSRVNGQPALEQRCVEWLQKQGTLVQDCR